MARLTWSVVCIVACGCSSSGAPEGQGGADDDGATGGDNAGDALPGDDATDVDGDAGLTTEVRRAAASETAESNALCVAIHPFYWEIGDESAALGSGSVHGTSGTTYDADSVMAVASASKWIYSTYYVQKVAGALTADDIKFFNFWSGYTDFTSCSTDTTVGGCLSETNSDDTTNGTFEAATENKFYYGGGHMQKHAALNGLASMNNAELAAEIQSQIGVDIALGYSQPQPAGGAYTSATAYAKLLRKIISGQLLMKGALGTHPVCTDPTTCDLAISSPGPPGEEFHYAIGHWVEDDPDDGDGSFSSAGTFGFYPWIDATKTLYGIVARKSSAGSGFDSLDCGRLIRKAWVSGVVQ